MLAESAAFATEGLDFQQAAIESFAYGGAAWPSHETTQRWDGSWGLIFSNAALQYAEEHAKLFPALCAKLAPGGQLAVQMPCNEDHPAFRLAGAIAAEPHFAQALGGYVRQTPVQPPQWYANLLYACGLTQNIVRMQVYSHELADPGLVVEWVKGTLLNNYTSRLDEATSAEYLAEYASKVPGVLGGAKPYLFTFNRLFIRGVQQSR
jgi:trans-aconitate 2-methyltransferase